MNAVRIWRLSIHRLQTPTRSKHGVVDKLLALHPGVQSLILGFFSLLDETLSCGLAGFYRTQYPASYTHKSLGRTRQFTLPASPGTQTCLLSGITLGGNLSEIFDFFCTILPWKLGKEKRFGFLISRNIYLSMLRAYLVTVNKDNPKIKYPLSGCKTAILSI